MHLVSNTDPYCKDLARVRQVLVDKQADGLWSSFAASYGQGRFFRNFLKQTVSAAPTVAPKARVGVLERPRTELRTDGPRERARTFSPLPARWSESKGKPEELPLVVETPTSARSTSAVPGTCTPTAGVSATAAEQPTRSDGPTHNITGRRATRTIE